MYALKSLILLLVLLLFSGGKDCDFSAIAHQILNEDGLSVQAKHWDDMLLASYARGLTSSNKRLKSTFVSKIKDIFFKMYLLQSLKKKYRRKRTEFNRKPNLSERLEIFQEILVEAQGSRFRPFFDGDFFKLISHSGLSRNLQNPIMRVKSLADESAHHFRQHVKKFEKKYGNELLTESDYRVALMNVIAMDIFGVAKHGKKADSNTIFSMAMLHPLVDGFMDKGKISKRTLTKIEKKIKGETVVANDIYEKTIFDLIDNIYEVYPIVEHPMLKDLLLGTLHAQVKSMKQLKDLDLAEILHITSEKGGMSTSLFGYVAHGGLSRNELEFYYRGGGIYQLMDDFSDIKSDRIEGIRTVWTRLDVEEDDFIRDPLNGTFGVYDDYIRSVDNLTNEFDSPELIRDFFYIAYYNQSIFSGLKNGPLFENAVIGKIMDQLNLGKSQVTHNILKEFSRELMQNISQNESKSDSLSDVLKFLTD